jgi:hypothetical protein
MNLGFIDERHGCESAARGLDGQLLTTLTTLRPRRL